MVSSRLRRQEEKLARRKIAVGVIGIVAVSAFLLLFGVRLLVAFSLFVDRIRGGSPDTLQTDQSLLLPPVLESLPQATNSATISVSGSANPDSTLMLFIDGDEYTRIPVGEDGSFEIQDIPVDTGKVTVSARSTDGKETVSDISNTISTTIDRTPPDLDITKPADNETIRDGTNSVAVEGTTDPDARLTINDRIVVVRSNGSFSYNMPLNDGENTLVFKAVDLAGNSIEVDRRVTYQP